MDTTNTIIVVVVVALIYVFIIKPRKEKNQNKKRKDKNQNKEAQDVGSDDSTLCSDKMNDNLSMQTDDNESMESADRDSSFASTSMRVDGSIDGCTIPDAASTKTVVWLAHCINLPFLPLPQNMEINNEMMSLLNEFENSVKLKDQNANAIIREGFQNKVKSKFGPFGQNCPMDVFKFCNLNVDLLNLYKMVIEGTKDESVLSGKGSIRRILKYSIELGAPASTLNFLTSYFVNNLWFMNMPEQNEWLKLALECMMVSGNGELGNKILGILKAEGDMSDEEIDELLEHAHEFRTQVDDSWMIRG